MPIYILIIKILGGGSQPPPPPPPACQTPVQSFSAGSSISQQVIILPNVCQTSVQAKSVINKPIMILPSLSQFVFNNNDIGGVTAPPIYFFTLTNQLSGPPRHPQQQGSNRRRPKALRTRSPQHPHHEGSNRRRPKTLSTISPTMEGPKP